ncbi:BON domain-containing protein [Novosphingobium clariflavum]|uniref:BON domain-containing protein n=1 Tax=Novosphingobium clariflavum TaxID=2029884 RepID=A0ABV6SAT4_9SPHN|nr:BON domain-containing protein [Novosphingobium clariflavum]
MNRRDPNPDRQQHGGYRNEHSDWEPPRQANQWEDGVSRQAGSESDEGRFSSYGEVTRRRRLNRDETENRKRPPARDDAAYLQSRGYDERHYGDDTRDLARSRGYRFSGERDAYPSREYDASGGNDFADFTSEDYGGRDFYARRSGAGGGLSPSFSYRPTFDTFGRRYYGSSDDRSRGDHNQHDYGSWREYGEERGFLQRAGDEIASWFGDEDAARRRKQDHRGRGPSDYTRSDERIREDVNDRLTQDWRVDATSIRVVAKDGEVTLDGTVTTRLDKRRAEDLAEDVSGVKHVQNNLRLTGVSGWTETGQGGSASSNGKPAGRGGDVAQTGTSIPSQTGTIVDRSS